MIPGAIECDVLNALHLPGDIGIHITDETFGLSKMERND